MNVYDFDNTIYSGDSTADFYFFALRRHPKIIIYFPRLVYSFVKFYIFKKGSKTQFKEKMFRFLRLCNMEKDLPEFWDKHMKNIKPFYIKQQKADDVIISASPRFLLKPCCDALKINYLIASEVNPQTGKYTGVNCRGKEKARRFLQQFRDGRIDKFYSDSYSDAPLAELADEAFLVKKDRLEEWKFDK